jgi:hypothetical protein
MDTIFTVSHLLKLADGSHAIQLNPDDSYFILNQIDLDVGRTILHSTATNARPLRRIAFQIEMGMTVGIELVLAAQQTLPKDVMDDSNVSLLQWYTPMFGITITALILGTHQGMCHDTRNANMAHICVIVITVHSDTFRTTRLNTWHRRFYFCNFDFRTLVSAERVHCGNDEKAIAITHDNQTSVCLDGSNNKSQFTVNNATTLGAKGNYGDSIQTSLNLNGNKLAFAVLPLFKGHESTIICYMQAHSAVQTEMLFLQQGETVCFGNVRSFVLDLDNVLYGIIAGPAADYVHSIRNGCDLISADTVMDICDMATTKVEYPNQIYRIKHCGPYDINSDEYAGAEFYIDRCLHIKTQLGDLSSTIEIAANDVTVIYAYYFARSDRNDESNRIFRTKDRILSDTTAQSEYVGSAHDDVSKCGSREADFSEFNITASAIKGYDTATTTITTTPTIATTATTAKRHNLANHWNGG